MTYEFLRPAGSMVNSTRGVASGPVSFMNIVNQTTEVVKQGQISTGLARPDFFNWPSQMQAINGMFEREVRALTPKLAALPADQVVDLFRRGLPLINSFLARYHQTVLTAFREVEDALAALPTAYWVNGDTGLKQTTQMAWANKVGGYMLLVRMAVITDKGPSLMAALILSFSAVSSLRNPTPTPGPNIDTSSGTAVHPRPEPVATRR